VGWHATGLRPGGGGAAGAGLGPKETDIRFVPQ
jgi:hypothetical protein